MSLHRSSMNDALQKWSLKIIVCSYICLTSLTRAKWNFPLNFRTMRKLSDLYSGIFQNLLTCAKWNFLLNFRTMRKLSDLYSGIFKTQSSGCASGVDLFRNFTKLKILNIWIVKYLLNCKKYLSYNFQIFQKISECWVLENLDVHLERDHFRTWILKFSTCFFYSFQNILKFQHAFLQFSEHTEISTCFIYSFQNILKISTCFFIVFQHSFSICFQHALQISTCSEIFNTLSNMKIWNIYSQIVTEPIPKYS